MKSCAEFNPYAIDFNSGVLSGNAPERMCYWYELELITDAENGGVFTYDQFLPALAGRIYIRRPGMIVQGIAKYVYYAILFDAKYDPEFEDMYKIGMSTMNMHFNPGYMSRVIERDHMFKLLDDLPPCIDTRDVDKYFILFDDLFHLCLKRPDNFQLYAKALIFKIITMLLDDSKAQKGEFLSSNQMMYSMLEIRKYIDANYMHDIALSDLSNRMSISREYLCRTFKRAFGVAPIEYLTSVRIFNARQMLVMTDSTIEEIAQKCGFASAQFFYTVFKRATGITPYKFRSARRKAEWKE